MATLISKNQENSLNLVASKSYELKKENVLIVFNNNEEWKEAVKWLETNETSGIFFDPEKPTLNFNNWSLGQENTITLENNT